MQAGDNKQRELLGKVNGDIAELVAQAEAAREGGGSQLPPRQRLRRQPPTPAAAAATGLGDAPAPGTSGRVGAVLAYAYAQLGKPYCYAGVGPELLRLLRASR